MTTDKLPELINAVSGGEKVFATFQPLIHEEDPPWNAGELIPECLPDLNRGWMADHHVVAHSEVVFIDSAVADVSALLPGDAYPATEIIRLESGQDGVRQIAAVLAGRSGLDTIHIVSHGSEGALLLGTATLSASTLDSYRNELATIGHALSSDGDMLLYGCSVAEGSEGASFVHALAEATGADIAASTNATGNAALGGDWSLEMASGSIESAGFATPMALGAYSGLLADDYSADPSTTGTVSVGGSSTGVIETPNDVDWFKVTLSADQVYQIHLEGSPTSQGTLSEPYFRGVYDDAGAQIPQTADPDWWIGNSAPLTFMPLATGTYYLAAGAHSTLLGTYRLSVAILSPGDDHIIGTPGDDTLYGYGGNDTIDGLAGNDQLFGGPGNDSLVGGDGNDWFIGGPGNDTLDGGTGDDLVSYAEGAVAGVVVNLGDGTASGGCGDDTLLSIEWVLGTQYGDTLVGGVGDNLLFGMGGNDSLAGGPGNDKLIGMDGNDSLAGGPGNDVLDGGLGADTLVGGAGDDSFVFSTYNNPLFTDTITDFTPGDTIEVTDVTLVGHVTAGDGSTVGQGEVQFASGTNTLYIGTNTTSGADVNIRLIGSFTAAAFYLSGSDLSFGPAPTVLSFSPSDGATGVATSSNIVLSFSEPIAGGTGSILLKTAAGATVETFDPATSNRLTISGSTLTIDPTSSLANGTHYYVTLAAGTIKDLAGNSYVGTSTYDFTTAADTTAPTVTTFSPSDGATGVATSSNIVLSFSEPIAGGTGSILLKTAAGATVETFDPATSNRLTISGSTLTIDPTSTLADGTHYYVTIAAGTIKDLAGNNYTGTSTYDFTTAADTTAPTVTTFSPSDGATGVATSSNIVLSFSEPIAGGTGSILLKTAAGATVEAFDAATSNRLTISGSTLTIDPTSTLANDTDYYLTLAAGTIKDLAGNSYAGTSTYDFTTAADTTPAPSYTVPGTPGNDFFIPSAGNNYMGGGGNDTYVISPNTLSGAVTAKITDTEGNNVIQLVDGMTISASSFYGNAAQLTLASGAIVQILGASALGYQVGANAPAGDTAATQTYSQFAIALGGSVPTGSTPVPGTAGYVVPSGFTQAPALTPAVAGPSYTVPGTLGNDFFIPSAGNNYLGGGGNDTYVISPMTLSGAVTARITDTEGVNVIQWVDGMTLTASSFYHDAAQLTLSTGAKVQILGASRFNFQLGANAPAGDTATSQTYAQFANTLGVTLPADGAAPVSGTPNFVVPTSGSAFTVVDLSSGTVTASAAAEEFRYDFQIVGGRITKAGDGEVTINGFDVAKDKLVFVNTTNHTVYTEAEFKVLPGVSIADDPFDNSTSIHLDPAFGASGGVTLTGIFDGTLSQIVLETI